jgi:hypothetical protein
MECLLTCGLGDFLALCHFISPEERKSIRKIYWATPAMERVKKFVYIVFPNVKEEEILFDEFDSQMPFFNSAAHVQIYLKKKLGNILDYSIYSLKVEMHHGLRSFHNLDEIYEEKLSNISLDVNSYVVIHPHSDNSMDPKRDLNGMECRELVDEIEEKGIYGVVINKSRESFPIKSERIVDLTNKLSVYDCIEVLKGAEGFIGCSSVWSVVASKLLSDNIFIKTHNVFKSGSKNFYYHPNADSIYESLQGKIKIRVKNERTV